MVKDREPPVAHFQLLLNFYSASLNLALLWCKMNLIKVMHYCLLHISRARAVHQSRGMSARLQGSIRN